MRRDQISDEQFPKALEVGQKIGTKYETLLWCPIIGHWDT